MLTIKKSSSSAIKHICTHACILCSNDLFLPHSVPMHIPARGRYWFGDLFFFFSSSMQESEFPDTELSRGYGSYMNWWAPHPVTSSATAGNILVCKRTLQRLWTCDLCIGRSALSQWLRMNWGWTVTEANVGWQSRQETLRHTWLPLRLEDLGMWSGPYLNYNYNQHL